MTKSAPRAGGGRGRGAGLASRRKYLPEKRLRQTAAGGCEILTAQKGRVLRGFPHCMETKKPGEANLPGLSLAVQAFEIRSRRPGLTTHTSPVVSAGGGGGWCPTNRSRIVMESRTVHGSKVVGLWAVPRFIRQPHSISNRSSRDGPSGVATLTTHSRITRTVGTILPSFST